MRVLPSFEKSETARLATATASHPGRTESSDIYINKRDEANRTTARCACARCVRKVLYQCPMNFKRRFFSAFSDGAVIILLLAWVAQFVERLAGGWMTGQLTFCGQWGGFFFFYFSVQARVQCTHYLRPGQGRIWDR